MPACSKPNNDIVSGPAQRSASEIVAKLAGVERIAQHKSDPQIATVPEIQPAAMTTRSEVGQAIRELQKLRSKKGVDIAQIDRLIQRLESRQKELVAEEHVMHQLDPIFLVEPPPVGRDVESGETVEIASWATGATTNEVGAVAERAAGRWAEQFLGVQQGKEEHGVNEHHLDHVLVDGSGNLFVAETKGTAGIGRTEQARYETKRYPGPKTLLSKGQMTDSWIEKDDWITGNGLDREAVAEKLLFRVDVTSQSIDVFAKDEDGVLGEHIGGPYRCDTLDLVRESYGTADPSS